MRHYLFSGVYFWVGMVFMPVGGGLLGLAAAVGSKGNHDTQTVGLVVCVLMGASFFAGGAAMAWTAARTAAHRASVVRFGQRVSGTVVDIRDGRTTVETNQRKTRYQFVEYGWIGFDGLRHTARSPEADPKHLDQFRGREEIAVYVDPADPAKAEIDVYGLREFGR